MSTNEKLTQIEQENSFLKQQIQQLNSGLQNSQRDFEDLKSQNSQLIASNNALTEQISILTKEIGELKSQFLANSQPTAAASPNSGKPTKRSSITALEDGSKKSKIDSWYDESVASNSTEPMQLNTEQQQLESQQPNLTNPAKRTDLIEQSTPLSNQNTNTNTNSNDFRTVSYKKLKQKPAIGAKKSDSNTTKSTKPAPIQVNIGKDGYLALHAALNRKLGNGKFVANNMMANQAVRIQPIDMKNSTEITNFLKSHEYEFHTFKNKSERGKCFILRGLNEFSNSNAIYEALVQGGFPKETTIVQHITGFQRAHPEIKHNILFRIVTPSSFDEKIIGEIDALFDLKVKFEKMKGNKVIQCKRCQEYFHTASSCHHPFRCVKCKESHDIGDCPRDINPDLPIRCVNCDGAHSANNYKECKYFNEKIAPILNKKGQKSLKQNKPIAKSVPSAPVTSHINNNTSFAAKVKGAEQAKPAAKPANQQINVSVRPNLSLNEKFDKFLEAQLQFQNHMVQMFGSLSRTMAPSGPRRY